MMIDPQLRQRILRSLRWLVRDAQYRFEDCKEYHVSSSWYYEDDSTPSYNPGYSPELKEAMMLLEDLEQGTMLTDAPIRAHTYTEDECMDTGYTLGMKIREIIEFYTKYGSQGWLLGNGLPIVDLRLAMRQWHLRNQEDIPEPERNQHGKTPRQLEIERRNSDESP